MIRHPTLGDRFAVVAVVVILTAAGCASSPQTDKVQMSGEPARVPEGPVLNRDDVARLCATEPFACALGGLLYLDIDRSEDDASIAEHRRRAKGLLSKGCDAELPVACATLAAMYVTGRGVERDLARAESLYRRACEHDGAFGCVGLGRMYESGVSVEKSAPRSGNLFERACQLGDGSGCYRLWKWRRSFGTALGAFTAAAQGCVLTNEECCDALEDEHEIPVDDGENRAKLVRRLDDACQAGQMSACELLGRHYESGDSTAHDPARAVRVYRRACQNNKKEVEVPRACDRLGALYETGTGVEQDIQQAASLFEKSCTAGWSVACTHLGSLYERGSGVSSDGERAMTLYRKACARGHARACFKVGDLLDPTVSGDDSSSPKVKDSASEEQKKSESRGDRSVLRAAVFYQIGCSSGSGGACNTLGLVAERSGAINVASPVVARLYQRACRMGSAHGCFNLGASYRLGDGVERSAAEAVKYFRRACEGGMTKGCQFIGLQSEEGDGTDQKSSSTKQGKRYERALRTVMLLENACEQGAARACTRAGTFHRAGRGGLDADDQTAVQWFQRGCERGDPDGCAQYAYHLQEGLGIDKNVDAAAKQYAVACRDGSASSCTYLGVLYATGEVKIDEADRRAAELFKAACEEEDLNACVRLARMKRGGWSVPIEAKDARTLFEKACDGGHQSACEELEDLDKQDNGSLETDRPPGGSAN